MKKYNQLTQEERYHIKIMIKAGISIVNISATIDRHKSTIYRELQRNTGLKGYRYKQAHNNAIQRHKSKAKQCRLTPILKRYIKFCIGLQQWSPEQISGRLKQAHNTLISTETIYRYIIADKAEGGPLYTHLRRCYSRRYSKRYSSRNKRIGIKGRVDISKRPSIVDERSRIGDWEADTIIWKGHKGAVVTLLERKSRLFLAYPLTRKRSEFTANAINKLLSPLVKHTHTITFDNGKEFVDHLDVASTLDCKTYFARPYSSWQRGANENANGLLRQYLPKQMPLHKVKHDYVMESVEKMNNRPRKCLGFKTPWEVFNDLTKSSENVALMG